MTPALQVYSRDFDADFFKLTTDIQRRIESSIDRLGSLLDTYPHQRMSGVPAFRLRVGDYRVLYNFDLTSGTLRLLSVGHRRDVYRAR